MQVSNRTATKKKKKKQQTKKKPTKKNPKTVLPFSLKKWMENWKEFDQLLR